MDIYINDMYYYIDAVKVMTSEATTRAKQKKAMDCITDALYAALSVRYKHIYQNFKAQHKHTFADYIQNVKFAGNIEKLEKSLDLITAAMNLLYVRLEMKQVFEGHLQEHLVDIIDNVHYWGLRWLLEYLKKSGWKKIKELPAKVDEVEFKDEEIQTSLF